MHAGRTGRPLLLADGWLEQGGIWPRAVAGSAAYSCRGYAPLRKCFAHVDAMAHKAHEHTHTKCRVGNGNDRIRNRTQIL